MNSHQRRLRIRKLRADAKRLGLVLHEWQINSAWQLADLIRWAKHGG